MVGRDEHGYGHARKMACRFAKAELSYIVLSTFVFNSHVLNQVKSLTRTSNHGISQEETSEEDCEAQETEAVEGHAS